MYRFLISLFLFLVGTHVETASAEDKVTGGDCSPVIERTGGNVTVKCGKADIEVEFLVQVVRNECNAFGEQMRVLESTIRFEAGKIFDPSTFPRFGNQIVSDIRENKAVIYEYDKVNFITAYRAIVDIDNLYTAAIRTYDNGVNRARGFAGAEQRYLTTVDKLCTWAGVDLGILEWILRNGDYQNVYGNSDLTYEHGLKIPPKLTDELANAVRGRWCSVEGQQVYIFHWIDGHSAGVTEGTKSGIFIDVDFIAQRRIWWTGGRAFNLITGFGSDTSATWAGGGYTDSRFILDGDILTLESNKIVERENPNDQYSRVFKSKEESVGKRFSRCQES